MHRHITPTHENDQDSLIEALLRVSAKASVMQETESWDSQGSLRYTWLDNARVLDSEEAYLKSFQTSVLSQRGLSSLMGSKSGPAKIVPKSAAAAFLAHTRLLTLAARSPVAASPKIKTPSVYIHML